MNSMIRGSGSKVRSNGSPNIKVKLFKINVVIEPWCSGWWIEQLLIQTGMANHDDDMIILCLTISSSDTIVFSWIMWIQ